MGLSFYRRKKKMELKEIFDVIKTANNSSASYTTHDKAVADAEREHIMRALKAKWPREAAMLDTTVPGVNFHGQTSKL